MNQPIAALAVSAGLLLPGALAAAPPETGETRTIRLIQDDAQEYMISKVYELKYLKANDVAPFVLGVVKRNNTQSTVNRINYRAGDEQLLTVSCPVRMMPYVDDLIAKLDRPARVAGGGEDPIRGTGITRNLYPARFRSARIMVDVMTGTGINGGADSFVGRMSCVARGASDTTFYILAVYFGSVGITKTRNAVTCGLIADLSGIIAAIIISYIFFF